MSKVRVLGPHDNKDRAPTLMFLVEGNEPDEMREEDRRGKSCSLEWS